MSSELLMWLVAGFLLGLFIFWLITRFTMDPVVGTLIIDTTDWNTDKYEIRIERPLSDLPQFKVVSLRIREVSKGSNETD